MAQLLQFSLQKNKIFISFIFLNLYLRFYLSSISLGGGDLFNAQIFSFGHIINMIFILFGLLKKVLLPYLPFTKFIYFLIGNLSETLNITFAFLTKFLASSCDWIIGLIIFKYLRLNKVKNAKIITLIYLFNPLTIFVTSQLGFLDSLVILLLVYCCYKFDQKLINQDIIVFCLALSFCIKPFTILFFPFFFLNSEKKLRFLVILFLVIYLANIFYIREINYETIVKIIKYIFMKMTIGHQISNHGLGLLSKNVDKYYFGISYLLVAKLLFVIIFCSIYLFLVKRIKSIKFVYLIFFSIFLFSSNIHWQYFIWIVPFMFLYNFNYRTIIFNIGFFILTFIYSIQSSIDRNDAGLYILKNKKNFFDNNLFKKNIFFENQIYLIFIYFICLIINLKINPKVFFRLIKKITGKISFIKYFEGKKNYDYKFEKIYIVFGLVIVLFISNYGDIYNSTNKIKPKNINNLQVANEITIPSFFKHYLLYGSNKTIKVNLNDLFKKSKILRLNIETNYFYEIEYNGLKRQNLGYDFAKDLGGTSNLYVIKENEYLLKNSSTSNLKLTFNQFKNLKHDTFLKISFKSETNLTQLKNNDFKCLDNKKKIICDLIYDGEMYIFKINSNYNHGIDNRVYILFNFLILQIFQLIFLIYYKKSK